MVAHFNIWVVLYEKTDVADSPGSLIGVYSRKAGRQAPDRVAFVRSVALYTISAGSC